MKRVPNILNKISLGDNTIYRGHANNSWELKPSIGRHYTSKWSEVTDWEIKSLSEFKKCSVPYLKSIPNTDIEWLCLMQHYGCATRLLDFTSNPLIALFFASDPSEKNDGEVVIAKYKSIYETVSNEDLFMKSNSFAYYPPHITERIVGQSGCFIYANTPNLPLSGKQIKNIIIPKEHKFQIRNELKSLGISYSSLFPSLDGICQDLNDKLIRNLQMDELFS